MYYCCAYVIADVRRSSMDTIQDLCNPNMTFSLVSAPGNCSINGGDCDFGGIMTPNCALFDFVLYTVVGGTLCAFGLVGNALSFIVLHFGGDNSSKTAATTLLLRALAVADSLVLVTCLPLYVIEPVNVYTGHTGSFHHFYMVVMPYLWPLYLMSLTATILLTVLVSFHRYTAVCKPYHSATLSSLIVPFSARSSYQHALWVRWSYHPELVVRTTLSSLFVPWARW